MSAAFTPGPWAVSNNTHLVFGASRGIGLEPLGFVYGPSGPEDSEVGRRAMADCRLIAAAPDLLAALKGLLPLATEGCIGGPDAVALINAATAAIAKALPVTTKDAA